MIRLTQPTSDLVSLITAQNGAKTVAAFTDTTATTWAGLNEVHSITSATTTTIVATPAASTIREIDFINIYNTYAGPQLLTVQLSVSATLYILVAFTLLQGESLQYTHAGGWCAIDANGNRKEVTSSVFSSLTVTGSETVGGTFGVTGNTTLSGTGNVIAGTATNDAAAAGEGGVLLDASATGQTVTSSINNIASLALTAGDWDVSGTAVFEDTGSNATVIISLVTT